MRVLPLWLLLGLLLLGLLLCGGWCSISHVVVNYLRKEAAPIIFDPPVEIKTTRGVARGSRKIGPKVGA